MTEYEHDPMTPDDGDTAPAEDGADPVGAATPEVEASPATPGGRGRRAARRRARASAGERPEDVPIEAGMVIDVPPPDVEPIRLFVGTDSNNGDLESQAVLEYTARKYASLPIEITWMQAIREPWRGWQMGSARTPFTHFRWSVPALCGYQGRAIYTDSDFIFRADLAELWTQDIPGVVLLRNPDGKIRTCAMLFDCAAARGHVPDLDALRTMADPQKTLTGYFKAHRELVSGFDGDWNCIDLKGYDDIDDPRIKAIHYSRMECQPHLKHALKRLKAEGGRHWYDGPTGPHWRPDLQALFDQLLAEALEAGYTLDQYRLDAGRPVDRRPFVYRTSKVAR